MGRAANYAAKLSGRSHPPTQITSDVYKKLNTDSKYSGTDGSDMWTESTAAELGGIKIYTSTWGWEL